MAIGEPDKRPADPVARLRTLVRFAKNKATQRKLAEKRGETPSRIPWAEKDGIAILHTDTNKTIEKLRDLGF